MDSDFKRVRKPVKSVEAKPAPVEAKTETPELDIFQTPEATAAADDLATPVILPGDPSEDEPTKGAGRSARLKSALALHWPPGRKEAAVAVALIVLIGGGTTAALALQPKQEIAKPVAHTAVKVAAKPTTVPSTLSGLPVAPDVNLRPVTAVMIENSVEARPQAGLGQASVVFEAIAEGGITRFVALFQDTEPGNIGPVRSARPYYEQWALGFDAAYAHVGGSPEALANVKAWGIKDLDQFANGGSYHRISSRAAPHNVYTSIATLRQLETAKGYTSSKFTGFTRKVDAPSKAPTAKTINISISGPTYNVHYDYNPANNSYKRSEGGAPHIDENTTQQISPKVVIALVMQYGLEADDHHSTYTTIGNGQAYVFQDGTVTVGQWSKSSATAQITFKDAKGAELKLNPGQTWLTAVGAATNVAYAP